jgi:glycosyltransferase involved in cell wall biosynthesis
MRRKRVLFTLTDLDAGGAERVVLTLLRHLSRDQFDLHLALVRKRGRFLSDVPSDIPLYDLAAPRVRRAGPAIVSLAREIRPDVIFSTLSYMNNYLLLLRPFLPRGTRIIVREGITVSSAINTWKMSWLWPLLFRILYRFADCIICQCKHMGDDLVENFNVPRGKIATIYNPVDVGLIRALADQGEPPFADHGRGPHVVAAGRLSYQKGFDLLIEAFPALLEVHPEAHLWILGDDTSADRRVERDLLALCRRLAIDGRVHFAGFQDNPYLYFKHADLFALSSRYEGLPNVLLEAMACGCPTVALDRPGGTREIMELTGNRDRLRKELDWDRSWFRGEGGRHGDDLSRFDLDAIVRRYGDLLREV